MLTFKFNVSAFDSKKAIEVAALVREFGGIKRGSCNINAGESSGTIAELVEGDVITLFGKNRTMYDLPVVEQGVVNYLPAAARWFVFLAAAYGFCQLQKSHTESVNVLGISLDALIKLYHPIGDWERESIELQYEHFALTDFQIASTFF